MASQITCITKPDRYNDHEAITNVGGVRSNGVNFLITREQCADDIRLEAGGIAFVDDEKTCGIAFAKRKRR